jgi:bifunctional non-homologous end joining protein LigD
MPRVGPTSGPTRNDVVSLQPADRVLARSGLGYDVGMAAARDKLSTYRAKRDFATTPEPSGDGVGATGDDRHDEGAPTDGAAGGRFVVQRHRATRLHYDVRLELGGVLVSWAVPKGPTLDPAARHMAVHVEDHPLEYIDFEGVIPRKEYGGGDVIVWDRGTWVPADGKDPEAMMAKGDLHVDLTGEKLHGRFVFVRRGKGNSGGRDGDQWLLLHKRDEFAVEGWDPEDHPESVRSGRTNDEVADDPESMWHSDRPAAEAEVVVRPSVPEWEPPTDDELEALDALGTKGTWELQGIQLKLTNLDKVLFPARAGEDPVTKRDLIRYFASVAPLALRYLFDRPVNLNRFPQGADTKGFWHKEVPSHAPDFLGRWHNDEADADETQWYFVVDSVPAMAWMANYGAIELNPWTSRIPEVRRPTWALIDLDPGSTTSFEDLLVLARLHRTALDHLGVTAGAKVTGKRGIQIWVPVAPRYTFDETRTWVERLSRAVGATVPELVSWKWTKSDRSGLARLDYTQNAINKTLIAPWSTRPAAGAPVSVPIGWDELDDPDLAPDRWTVRTALDRIADVGDPLAPLVGLPQELPPL